jgi:predicted RecA/RadA family phage recombinase
LPDSLPPFALPKRSGTEFSVAEDGGRFDGNWNVTLVCPTDKFPAQVKNGVLHGENGTTGNPGWVALDGSIQADGSATLNAEGITNVPRFSAYQVQTGTPYTYSINAHFDGSRGNGRRIEIRACTLTFVKR